MAVQYHDLSNYVAMGFTNYLIENKLINELGISKDKLLNHYSDYQIKFPNYITRSDILSALRRFKFIRPASSNSDVVKFKSKALNSFPAQVAQLAEDVSRRNLRVYTNQQFVFRNKSKRDSGLEQQHCGICKMDLKDAAVYKSHLQSTMHKLRDMYRKNKKSLMTLASHLKIESSTSYTLRPKEEKTFPIILTSNFEKPITITRVFSLIQTPNVKLICSCPEQVNAGQKFTLKVKANFEIYGAYTNPVIFQLQQSGKDESDNFLVDLAFHIQTEEFDDLGPDKPYSPLAPNVIRQTELPIIKGQQLPPTKSLLKKLTLQKHPVPPYMIRILNHGFKLNETMKPEDKERLEKLRSVLLNTEGKISPNVVALKADNYVDRFNYLMWMEEHQIIKNIHDYDRSDQVLTPVQHHLLALNVPGLSEGRPSVLRGDSLFVKNKDGQVLYEGIVHNVEQETVSLGFIRHFAESYIPGTKVDVEFSYSRYPFRLCYRALDQVLQYNVARHLFPKSYSEVTKNPIILKPWYNKRIADNEQQKQAVQHIVNGTSCPAPYIIFGPPGTGKTVTLVESVKQLWALKKGRICVCAPSNSAADLITMRLIDQVPVNEVLRLYALHRANEIPDKIKPCSNYDRMSNDIYFPEEAVILKKSIIIMTVVTAGRLVNALNAGAFQYLFIDEAGHAMEPEMLIPIIGLLARGKTNDLQGQLILTGDPKQLGPIIQSSLAAQFGLDMSLLERLMIQCKIYEKDPNTNSYNPKVITKLINNYRSNDKLLYIPNKLFYDNELVSRANREISNCANDFSGLVSKGFPLLFHGIQGIEEREGNSPSYFNRQEMQIVYNYLDTIVDKRFSGRLVNQSDIGVITPYRKQVQKLKRLFATKRNWNNIDVASVEEFQGQEKLVIIITTVRSRHEFLAQDYKFGLGFLRNPKRFNVAITRAKALLIVVGNPDILQCDPNWKELMQYCLDNNSFKGYKPAKPLPADFEPLDKLSLDLSALEIQADNPNSEDRPGLRTDL